MDDQAIGSNNPQPQPPVNLPGNPPTNVVGQSSSGAAQRQPLRIDMSLLDELGLGSLPQEEKTGLLNHIYETLEMRVGMRLADQMSNEQLDEFETFYNAKDDAGAFHWLETNFPNYKDIVAEEFAKLKGEVGQSVPQILAASQQSAAGAAAVNPAGQHPPQVAPMQGPSGQSPTQPMPGYPPQAAPSQAQPYAAPPTPPSNPMPPFGGPDQNSPLPPNPPAAPGV